MAVTLVTVFGEDPVCGSPLIHVVVLVLDAENRQILSPKDGELLTAVFACVGAATDFLTSTEAKNVAIIGSGK